MLLEQRSKADVTVVIEIEFPLQGNTRYGIYGTLTRWTGSWSFSLKTLNIYLPSLYTVCGLTRHPGHFAPVPKLKGSAGERANANVTLEICR